VPKDVPPAAAARPDEGPEVKAAEPAKQKGEKRARQRLRCGTCGFVLVGSNAEKACPACGSPVRGEGPEALGPFESRLGPKRSRLLGLRLHPMAAHAAPAFAATVLALSAAIAAVGEAPVKAALIDAARVLSAAMPLAIVAAFLTGLFDGRLRLKKGTTPLLVRKMAASALFLALSFAAAALALFTALDAPILAPFAVLAALEAACALYLGRKGASLRDAAVPD
jgi:hypothetical protein